MDGAQHTGGALHRFTIEDYHRMAEAGVFGPDPRDARVELIRGTVVDMPPIGTPHLRTVNRLNMLLVPLVAGRAVVSVQNSVRLDEQSEPEPDLVLLAPEDDPATHPGPKDVLLLIEDDRNTKAPLYADHGIIEYWIVNLIDRLVEVHRDPANGGYRQVARATSGRLAIQALSEIEITVEQVFP